MKPKLLKGKKLTKALDDKIREIFKAKYGSNPTCFVCGRMDSWWNSKTYPRGIQVGHFVGRKRTVLRWSLLNVFPQCSGCNIIHNTNPAPFAMAIINDKTLGIEHINLLRDIAKNAVGDRVTETQKRDLLAELSEYPSFYKNFDKPTVMC